MRLEESALPIFGRHETFHLRYGWLKQAYNHSLKDGDVFSRDDAPVTLGVGKNMVRSMKFWALADKVLRHKTGTKNGRTIPTDLGHIMFGDRGLDPYLGEPETAWLIHWWLLAPPCSLPAWWAIINEARVEVSSATDLVQEATSAVYSVDGWKPSKQSIKRDIDVFLHTYFSKKSKKTIDDYLDCPLRVLGLMLHQDKDVRFVFGRKHGLSPLVVAYACLDFVDRVEILGRTVSINKLALEKGGPGMAFKISEADMTDMLSEVADTCSAVSVSHVNGMPNMTFKGKAGDAALQVLHAVYGHKALIIQDKEVLA